MDKILRINMSSEGGPTTSVESIGKYKGLGGRGMTSTIIATEVNPKCDPLSADNKLVIAPGIVSGTATSTSGRMSVGFKSPMTEGIKESNSGGQASQHLAKLGYAAIVIEGKPVGDDLYKILLDKDAVKIEKANELKGLGTYDVADKIKDQYGDKKVGLMCVGIAGENLMINSTIAFTDPEFRPTRHAARGGGGAVMGSKAVKAIVIQADGLKLREPKDKKAFQEANRNFVKEVSAAAMTGKEGTLRQFGSAAVADVTSELGGYPALGATQGSWEGVAKINGSHMVELENARGGQPIHACHTGCTIECSAIYTNPDGTFLSKQPEYETAWSLGGYLGVNDPDKLTQMDRLCDDIGLDTIEAGVTIGVLMQGSDEFSMGNADDGIKILEEIKSASSKGKFYGSGAYNVGKEIGYERVPVMKKQAMAAYDPRGFKGLGVTYATSPMGGDHTAGHTLPNHLGAIEPKVEGTAIENQWLASSNAQIDAAASDTTGVCGFADFAGLDRPDARKYLLEAISAFTGDEWNENSWLELGKKILRTEIDFNRIAGLTEKDDKIPEWMKREPLPPHNSVFDIPDSDLRKTIDSFYK